MYFFCDYLRMVLIAVLLLNSLIINAQTPGNVSHDLGLWLKASDLTPSNNTTSNWDDAHSTNNNATYKHNPSIPNAYYEVVKDINFNNSVHFNDEWFESPLDINIGEVNVFTVYKLRSTGNNIPLWGNGGTNPNNLGKQAFADAISSGNLNDQSYSGGNTTNEVCLNHINTKDGATSSVYINGVLKANYTAGITVDSSLYSGTFIGREKSGTLPVTNSNNLDIAEFIVYTGSLSEAQRKNINSYLAIKYGVTLDHDYLIGNGNTIVWEQLQNTGFNNNIAGIAKDDDSDLEQLKSRSEVAPLLTLLTATISNGEALVIGDNAAATNTKTTFQEDNNFFAKGERIDRIWKCQKTAGFGATVDLKFDKTNTVLPSDFAVGTFVLLLADDDAFSKNLKAYPLTNGTTDYEATNVALQDGQYFTLAKPDAALWAIANSTLGQVNQWNNFDELDDNVLGLNKLFSPGGERPTYGDLNMNPINFNTYIEFNQGTHNGNPVAGKYIKTDNFVGFGETGTSTFLVLRRDTTQRSEALLSYAVGAGALANEMLIFDPSSVTVAVEEGTLSNGNASTKNIADGIPHVLTNIRGNGQDNNIRLDGNGGYLPYKNNTTIDLGGTLLFGQEQDNQGGGFNTAQEYKGDLAEVIVFNKRVNNNERNAIETYLAIKYGITLGRNYHLSTNTVTWDKSANATYHHNVTGIGRDDVFWLDQRKSTSQKLTGVNVTIEHAAPFSDDLSHLIWGHNQGVYDNFTVTNAPANYQISDRVWKAQNVNNRVGRVNVTLVLPPSMSNANNPNLRLLVNHSDDFSTGAVSYPVGTTTGGTITFENVLLEDDTYFTLSLMDDPDYVNHDPGAPLTFEACAGSNVTFRYTGLNSIPDSIQLMDKTGNPIVLSVTPNNTPANGQHSGTIDLTIPSNAGTGAVKILDGSTVLSALPVLIIHNPTVDFFTQKTLICATDEVPLIGVPTGGIFTATGYPDLLQNESLFGKNANWSNAHDGSKVISVEYAYTPSYMGGALCYQSIDTVHNITIFDNRLEELSLLPIVTEKTNPSRTDRVELGLNTSTINSIFPDLMGATFPIHFSGTYVNPIPTDSFLTDYAGYGEHPITMQYDNGGCIGTINSTLKVLPPPMIIGMVDTLCRMADTIHLRRDLVNYPYSTDSDTFTYYDPNGVPMQVVKLYQYNELVRFATQNSAHQSSLISIGNAVNEGHYSFDPKDNALNSASFVVFENEYKTTITTIVGGGWTIDTSKTTVLDTIHLKNQPILNFAIDNFYCENSEVDSLTPTPSYLSAAANYFEIKILDPSSGNYNILDTLLQDTLLDASYHYGKHTASLNGSSALGVQLTYYASYHGCQDSVSKSTEIRPAPTVTISARLNADYCINATPDTMVGAPSASTGVSGVYSGSGIDSVTGIFTPSLAGTGRDTLFYTFTGQNGCTETAFNPTTVHSLPDPGIISPSNNTTFLNTNSPVQLTSTVGGGTFSSTTSGLVTANGSNNYLLNPNTLGIHTVTYTLTDVFGCTDSVQYNYIVNDGGGTVTYTNNDPNAPAAFEACVGSSVRFTYDGLRAHPNQVQLVDTAGNIFAISNIQVSTLPVPVGHSGTIDLIIPANTGTGTVKLLDNTVSSGSNPVLYSFNTNLIVHNPSLDLLIPQTLICAMDTIPVFGVPTGGTFSAVNQGTYPDLFENNHLVGLNAGWSFQNDSAKTIGIAYHYVPSYFNGGLCPDTLSVTKTVEIRDNRLDELHFVPVVSDSLVPNIVDRVALALDSAVIRGIIPSLDTSYHFPIDFSGTYVNPIPTDTFLTDYAGFGEHPIQVTYNNGGCIGTIISDLVVLSPLQILGLDDDLCREASPVDFYPDGSVRYAYSISNSIDSLMNGNVKITTEELNRIDSVITRNVANQGAIIVLDSTHGQEHYQFVPMNLPVGTNRVTVEMHYTSITIIKEIDTANNTISSDTTKESFKGIHIINIKDRPTLNIALASHYCKNGAIDTLTPSPAFIGAPITYFELRGDSTGSGSYDSLGRLQEPYFNPQQIYDAYTFGSDLDIELIYVVKQYGCWDSDTVQTTIIKQIPVDFSIVGGSSHCTDIDSVRLDPSIAPTVGSGVFLVNDMIGSSTIITDSSNTVKYFSPRIARQGNYKITYQVMDSLGCKSFSGDKHIIVKEPPQIRLEVGGSSTSPITLCANDDSVRLETIVLSGGAAQSIAYSSVNSSLNIAGNTLFPKLSLANNSNSLNDIIRVTYVDSFGCSVKDFLSVNISKPTVDIAGFTRTITTIAYDGRYCNNATAFAINESPSYSSGANFTFTGGGVSLDTSGVYFYDPGFRIVDDFYIDTITYSFTDTLGCSNEVKKIVRIDSLPEMQLIGVDSSYCVNDTTAQLQGIPSATNTAGTGSYGGIGVNPNNGIFDPTIAGAGQKIISYTFIDRYTCRGIVFDTTYVHALPVPTISGYKSQYCSMDAVDTLIGSPSTGIYSSSSGLGIDPNTGIFNPSILGAGQHTLSYSFTDSLGCVGAIGGTITVDPTPEIIINGLKTAYCFNDLKDNILVSPPSGRLDNSHPGFTLNGNTIFFEPYYDTLAGSREFTYIYEDINTGCADTLEGETFVYKLSNPTYSGLDSFYCETRSTYPITGIPSGGAFSGAGILLDTSSNQYYFNPINAGGGAHIVNYTIDSLIIHNQDSLVCQIQTSTSVTVRALPVPVIVGPGNNHGFCSNDPRELLKGGGLSSTWDLFTSSTGGIDTIIIDSLVHIGGPNYRLISDTSYYFDPDLAGGGTHFITYIATDSASGCQDSTMYTYHVTDYVRPSFTTLDTTYCESAPPVLLDGSPSGIKVFVRNGDTLSSPPYFEPNPNYGTANLTATVVDTVIYAVTYGECYGVDTQLVAIKPVPMLSFTGTSLTNTYCLKDDTTSIPLAPNILGGEFDGQGVLLDGSTYSFLPYFAGVGRHPISYEYTDQTTGCGNVFIDTFTVLGMPNVAFKAIGGCQLDSVLFYPDNIILGLNDVFNNQIFDSITTITWELEPGHTVNGSNSANNNIDTIGHVFSSPGVYWPKLYVANRGYCVDTSTIRLVISPQVSTFPYDETFEISHGDWYAEAKDSTHPLLWEWGADSTSAGFNASANKMWATELNEPYEEGEAAWVYSPCFDISNLERPMIRFDYWSDTRKTIDGTVLEYQKPDGKWEPLGKLGRGISWFDTPIITGQPGDQSLAPIGWSGKTNGWASGRYKLDEFRANRNLRLRMAFGSHSINLSNFYDGFAFDNVWIGSRTRNVLLETTANINEPNMGIINDHVYQLVFHTSINKDMVLLQYHSKEPSTNDEFHLDNTAVANARTHYYGIFEAGRAYIDGRTNNVPRSRYLSAIDFEQDMLKSPKFKIDIDTFHHNNFGNFTIEATVEALIDINTVQEYQIHTVITEDSLVYASGNNDMVHAVVRKDDRTGANVYNKTWSVGETMQATLSWNHTGTNVSYNPGRFQAVVFIQNTGTKEVYQVNTSRDVNGYWVGVDQIQAEPELNEINSMNLYPNPAQQYFKVSFEEPLKKDYNWKLVDLRGVEVKSGMVQAGEQTLEVNDYDFPTGVYVFVVYNDHVFSQRKVIINRN
ncbi:T9SS type A sorting domain-containing protein [Aureispira anguillae]|uniref:T9SS type A sorting domain-containing protein n=1 Tax=Aureispira anguillae TaxID=2864201 RepID=A0A916DQJ6_9BACT|nr:T9SS type A sorting domain-containing protein [Aureispira anguillae]BDS11214.1 T9SS type A sorting domain-containing protein [Aureispira anguillae]